MNGEPHTEASGSVPRLILIEPSLEGYTGHHLEYAMHVLRAAAEAGYEPLLATNRRFPAEGDGAQSREADAEGQCVVPRDCAPSPFRTYRQYKYSFWSQPLVSGLGPMRWLYRRLRRLSAAVTHSRRTQSHCVESGRSETTSYDARPGLIRRLAGCWRQRFADPLRVRQFARDTESLIGQIGLRADDVFFLPGAGEIELEGLVRLFSRRNDAAQATWHLLFRRDPPSPDVPGGTHARLLQALRRIQPEYQAGRVRFYTDTDDLSREYERLGCVGRVANLPSDVGQVANLPLNTRQVGNLPHFHTLPIPHTDRGPVDRPFQADSDGANDGLERPSCRPLHVLYLGDARREKGYHHLPQIIADLWDDCLVTGRITMTIQSNPALTDDEPAIAAARRQLRSRAGSAITLIDEPLSSPEYRRLLHSGDLILLPYDRQAYRWRSSGILVEALAAGIPSIVPTDTWLARQSPAAVGVVYRDMREIPVLIRRIVADYGRYRQASLSFAPRWRAKHNAARLMALLAHGFGIDTV